MGGLSEEERWERAGRKAVIGAGLTTVPIRQSQVLVCGPESAHSMISTAPNAQEGDRASAACWFRASGCEF